jgi:long-chain acyl-CoA synthetase
MVDGLLRTGDVGYFDQDGYIVLVDRIKDLIICSGYNVYPRVIEEAIYRHPEVVAVTVVGMPDSYRGEAPAAFVQLRPGATATPEELSAFLKDKLSPIETPRLIEIRAELPKTMIGKLSKKELRAELLASAKGAAA